MRNTNMPAFIGLRYALYGAALMLLPTTASAQNGDVIEYPSAVATFQKICLVPGTNPGDRLTAIGSDENWSEDAIVTVDVPKMSVSPTISQNYSFGSPSDVRQWSGKVDGREARLVMATFGAKTRYPNLCALVLEGPNSAMSYGRGLRDAFKEYGIGGKSVDLVHYYEFAGKVGPDKHPVRGEIFSRSLSGKIKATTHIYVAY